MSNSWMKYADVLAMLSFALSVVAFAYMFMNFKDSRVTYDCRMAEISPDFPIEVKEECRKMRSGRI